MGTSQEHGKTRRIDKTVSSVLRKEFKADPNWTEAGAADFQTSGRSLRPRQQKCYAEADLPDLDLYLYCDDCEVRLFKQNFKSG